MQDNVVNKKKRGRKPNSDKIQKKRGRKPKKVEPVNKKNNEKEYRVSNEINEPVDVDSENVILHLQVHTNELSSKNNNIPIEVETTGLKTNYQKWIGNIENTDDMDDINDFSEYKLVNDNDKDNNNNTINNHENLSYKDILKNHDSNKKKNSENINPYIWSLDNQNRILHTENWHNNFIDDKKTNDLNNNHNINNVYNGDNNHSLNDNVNTPYNKKNDLLMKQFVIESKRNKWPSRTPIYCFWCCFPFNNRPCALPIEYKDDTYHVYGCFCSPECTAAYNFNDYQINDKKWERYSLINMLYVDRTSAVNKIKLAPPRQTLNIFGGPLNINQFRTKLKNYDVTYILNLPPMITINVQQEETELSNDTNQKNNNLFIPVDQERVITACQNLKLKRKKPVSDSVNTLENCMNLQFK